MQSLNIKAILYIIIFLIILSIYTKLFDNAWFTLHYIKYLVWFCKYQHSFIPFTKINLYLPFKFIFALVCSVITYIAFSILIRKLNNKSKKQD